MSFKNIYIKIGRKGSKMFSIKKCFMINLDSEFCFIVKKHYLKSAIKF